MKVIGEAHKQEKKQDFVSVMRNNLKKKKKNHNK